MESTTLHRAGNETIMVVVVDDTLADVAILVELLGRRGSPVAAFPRGIMALADVYDALRSARPYKEAFSHEKSVAAIPEGRGTHFDPAAADAFRECGAEFTAL